MAGAAEGGFILGHGTDGSKISAYFEATAASGLDLINSELVCMASSNKEYIVLGKDVKGEVVLHNTMFWGKENWAFFEDLRAFNKSLPAEEQIFVRSIDIEYKMESAIYVINELIGEKEIPESLASTVGIFKQLFENTRNHRESYQGLSGSSSGI